MRYLLLSMMLFLFWGCGSTASKKESSESINKAIIGTYLTDANVDDIKLSKDNKIAYLRGYGNLTILDISNPSMPKLLSHNVISEYAIRDMAILDDDKRIYLGVDSKVIILDISDKKKPKQVVSYQNAAINLSMELSSDNSKLYITTTRTRLGEQFFVLDIQDENHIVELGRQRTREYAHGIDLAISPDNTRAYVANDDWGLGIIDISDVQNLTLLTQTHIKKRAYSVVLSSDGQEAYVVTGSEGFTILNVSDFNDVHIEGNYESSRNYIGEIIPSQDGTKLYVLKEGLKVLDITNISQPILLSSFSIKHTRGMAISSDESKIYITKAGYSEDNTSGGLVILDLNYFKGLSI